MRIVAIQEETKKPIVLSDKAIKRIEKKLFRSIDKQKRFLNKCSKVKEFSILQPAFERVFILSKEMTKHSKYSKGAKVSKIERRLADKGITIRFNNNLGIAKLVQKSLNDVEKAGYDLPKYFFIIHPNKIFGTNGVTLMFRHKTASQAPIILPETIVYTSRNRYIANEIEQQFSTSKSTHSIIHEIGHWLHFHNKPNNQICREIWKNANKELIKNEVSIEALRREDGAEFVAEVFVGLVYDKKYSSHIMEIYKKLNGPLPKKLDCTT